MVWVHYRWMSRGHELGYELRYRGVGGGESGWREAAVTISIVLNSDVETSERAPGGGNYTYQIYFVDRHVLVGVVQRNKGAQTVRQIS